MEGGFGGELVLVSEEEMVIEWRDHDDEMIVDYEILGLV